MRRKRADMVDMCERRGELDSSGGRDVGGAGSEGEEKASEWGTGCIARHRREQDAGCWVGAVVVVGGGGGGDGDGGVSWRWWLVVWWC